MTGIGKEFDGDVPEDPYKIIHYRSEFQSDLISLWKECGLVVPWNDPLKDIARKMNEDPSLFFLGLLGENLISSCMAGYDGHRGWIYYLAVTERYRRKNYAREIVLHAECKLMDLGCPKIQLMVRENNTSVLDFYQQIGYNVETVKVLSKRLIKD